jgi:NhaP-type Na+/H+ or K+/H+ antiporter
MLFVSHLSDYVTWQCVVFGVLALTVLRMLPIWFSLTGSGLREPTKWFIAWFGPRGLASVVFALIAFESFGDRLPKEVWGVMGVTVLMCVFAHGITAPPFAERYGAWAERKKPTMELAG